MMNEQFSPDLFKKRTREIINQYEDKCGALGDSFYDVTLSVNCLYGLLMLPTAQNKKNLPKEDAVTFLKNHNIQPDEVCIEACHNKTRKTFRVRFNDLIVGLRNGLAHWGEKQEYGVCFKKNDSGIIEKLCITGSIRDYSKTVSATFLLYKNNTAINPIPAFLNLIQSDTNNQGVHQ